MSADERQQEGAEPAVADAAAHAAADPGADGVASPATAARLAAMSRAAAQAASDARPDRGEPPAAGDLYVFPATADGDVEWLLSAVHPQQPDRVRLVATDAAGWLGSADVAVAPEEAAAPLAVHCRHRLWWNRRDLAPQRRTGRVSAAAAAAAEEMCRGLDAEGAEAVHHRASPLRRETDDDPEYRDRDAELGAARTALEAAAGAAGRRREAARFRRPRPWSSLAALRAAAAILLVALAATGWWALTLSQRLGHGGGAALPVFSEPVPLAATRGEPYELRFQERRGVLRLVTGPELETGASYRAVIVDEAERTVFETRFRQPAGGEIALVLDRDDLPPGLYSLRIFAASPPAPEVLGETPLEVLAPE